MSTLYNTVLRVFCIVLNNSTHMANNVRADVLHSVVE